MGIRLLRVREACAKFGHRRSSHYEGIKAGLIPTPIKIGMRASATPENEIDAVVAARVAGLTDDEIRQLVSRLHAQRETLAAELRASIAGG